MNTNDLANELPRNAVTLSSTELLACWEILDLAEPPALLRLRRPGHTYTAQRQADNLLADALTNLGNRGLADTRRPHPPLTQMLRVIAHATHHLDIRYTTPEHPDYPRLAIGAIAGTQAAILTSNDGAAPLTLWPVDPSQVMTSLLHQLGPITPGRGQFVNIPLAILDQAIHTHPDAKIGDLAEYLHKLGIPASETNAMARMCRYATSGGQLGATRRHHSFERRAPWVVGFHHSQNNGYFMQLRRNQTLTLAPANLRQLQHHWQKLIGHQPNPAP